MYVYVIFRNVGRAALQGHAIAFDLSQQRWQSLLVLRFRQSLLPNDGC